jgi:AcrR family transcriptional regulator
MATKDTAEHLGRDMPSGVALAEARGERASVRRRGERLNEAIYQACLDELREHGYANLTMDGVAARARTGKATLYRRWPNKVELVASTLNHTTPNYPAPPDSGDLREELIALLRTSAEDLAGPVGAAARGLIAEVVRYPELAEQLREPIADPLIPPTMEILRRAVVRGEVPATVLTPRVASVANELSFLHFLLRGTPPSEAELVEIVDTVTLPMLHGLAATHSP